MNNTESPLVKVEFNSLRDRRMDGVYEVRPCTMFTKQRLIHISSLTSLYVISLDVDRLSAELHIKGIGEAFPAVNLVQPSYISDSLILPSSLTANF
jgi:hypothetical protein